ncbi:hypothetical protein [Mucilaginibacter sp. OK268]|uniref:hypothetical protein n=1 Tax=Mucilaginibacter sp. OK268 TaxID=1881048 RepID=UPI00115F8AC4|nr:hypothetical protein [Mucilaginibacter sp. OK268]
MKDTVTWTRENDAYYDCGIKPIPELNYSEHENIINLMHTKHAIKFDIASERELLMNPDISEKEKLRILVEKCNQSIRETNQIMYIIGRVKRSDWYNEIPNLYL